MINRGKQFEKKFYNDFLKLPGSTLDRIYDQISGRNDLKNICDFIGFCKPYGFYIECKSKQGNTFPLTFLTQYDRLVTKVGIPGVRVGVVIWFIDWDKVIYCPISTITQLKADGKKSVNIKMLEDSKYRLIDLPSTKKRVFLDTDYSPLLSLKEGE